ncbi:hypothetical protein Q3G72_016292 [Acer saccharum]|nr:hypothetical protein Q3G72_008614 [Acer saccharum]KAK1554715.1 hypothetical protein Q3G72_016292 [Acer saccharum]
MGFRSSGEVGKSDIIGSHHSMDDDERMVTDGGGEGCSSKCDDQHAEGDMMSGFDSFYAENVEKKTWITGQVSDSINGEVQSTGCIESLHTDICVGPDPVHHSSLVASKEFEDGLVDSSPIIADQVITQPKVIDPAERPSGSTRLVVQYGKRKVDDEWAADLGGRRKVRQELSEVAKFTSHDEAASVVTGLMMGSPTNFDSQKLDKVGADLVSSSHTETLSSGCGGVSPSDAVDVTRVCVSSATSTEVLAHRFQ